QDGGGFAFSWAFFSNAATSTWSLGTSSGSSRSSLTRAVLSRLPARSVSFVRASPNDRRTRTALLRSRLILGFGRRSLRQPPQQLLEVVPPTQRVEVRVPRHVGGVVEAGSHGLAQQRHRPVGVLLPLVGALAAGDRVDAGEVVPLFGVPVRRLRELR